MVKQVIKLLIYGFIDAIINPSRKIKPKSVLLIRLDAIGDYVLFRNFIEILKKNEKYRDFSLTLLGNIAYRTLAEELDSEFIDKFIWLDRKRFARDLKYRYKKLKEITTNGYEIVLSPVYSREFFVDRIVKLVNAKEKIGSVGDLSNIRKWEKNISDKYYSKLIPAKNEIMFEFYRNKEFFENILGVKIDIEKPHIELRQRKVPFELLQKYAIFFIGAGGEFRKWGIRNFAIIGKHIKDKYGYEIVLCGAQSDVNDALEFNKHFGGNYYDLVGRTNLIDLLYIIDNAKLMISNETMAPHLAVALNVKYDIFVISNGNHFGRFVPYPKWIAPNYHAIFHPYIENNLENYRLLSNSYGFGSRLDINEISIEKVRSKLDNVLM